MTGDAAVVENQDAAPWRCACCGFDARGRTLGDACVECGAVLDARSQRPAWLAPERIRRLRLLALAGALPGVVFVAFPLLTLVLGRVLASDDMAMVLIALLALTFLGFVMQFFAAIRIGEASTLPARRTRMRLFAILRFGGVLALVGFFLLEVTGTGLPRFVALALFFGLPMVVVGSDIALGLALRGFVGEARIGGSAWGAALHAARSMLCVASYAVFLVPLFLGGFVAPLLWLALSGIAFAALWWRLRSVRA